MSDRRATRKAARAAKHQAAGQVLPPEGVALNLPIAGIGVRIGAQIVDILITGAFVVSLFILITFSGLVAPQGQTGLGALMFFFIRIPYYILAELAWNGQTLGKRYMKIKVVAHDGGPLTTHALVMRNVMKEAEVFLPATLVLTLTNEAPVASWLSFAWVAMALTIPASNSYRMRLGDMLAGTHVVHLPQPVLLQDLAQKKLRRNLAKPGKFTFLPHQLDHYGSFELQTLESLLRVQDKQMDPAAFERNSATLAAITEKVRKKIGYADAVGRSDYVAFLQAFYNAQRAHLEQRQIFGERRANKHHRATGDAPEERWPEESEQVS